MSARNNSTCDLQSKTYNDSMEIDPYKKFRQYYNVETRTIEMPDESITLPEGGLGKVLFGKMNENRNNLAQIDPENGIKETHGQLLQKIIRTAIELKSLGTNPDDITLVCSNNHIDNIVPYLANIFIGGISTCIDPTITRNDMAYLLEIVKPKTIFTIKSAKDNLIGALVDIDWKCNVFVFGENFEDVFLCPKKDEDNFVPYYVDNINKTIVIIFSSGSTGFPKAISLSHAYYLYSTRIPIAVNVTYTSLYWASAVLQTLAICTHGRWRLIVNTFDPKKLWTYLFKYEPDVLFLLPVHAYDLFEEVPENIINCPLKLFILGGSTVTVDQLKHYMKVLPNTSFIYGYGLTEVAMALGTGVANARCEKLGFVGTPDYGRHYRVVDPDTEEVLGINQPGELRIKTKWMMNGYYKMDYTDQFDKDGFFRTGDIMYYDEDFYFYMVDRLKEVIKYRNCLIVPAKLEAILMKHPAVEAAIVVGIPHDRDDFHPMAVVKCKRNVRVTKEELCKFLNNQVDDKHQLRAGVAIVDDFIYTNTGKIHRRNTRDMVINQIK